MIANCVTVIWAKLMAIYILLSSTYEQSRVLSSMLVNYALNLFFISLKTIFFIQNFSVVSVSWILVSSFKSFLQREETKKKLLRKMYRIILFLHGKKQQIPFARYTSSLIIFLWYIQHVFFPLWYLIFNFLHR